MSKKAIGVVTDCICDLPHNFLKVHDVGVIYFLIRTDTGVFADTLEITSDNIFNYLEEGGREATSLSPAFDSYKAVFRRYLDKCERVLYIASSSKISQSVETAKKAIAQLEEGSRITILDSLQLSSGLGYIVMEAVEMAENGLPLDEIVSACCELRERVSTSFILCDIDHLRPTKKLTERKKKWVRLIKAHPVLTIRNGMLAKKYTLYGDFDKAARRYVLREIKNKDVVTKRMFLVCSGCPVEKVELTRKDVERHTNYDELIVTKASATVSTNCGKDSFGLIYVNKRKN